MSYDLDVFKTSIFKVDDPRLSASLTQEFNARRTQVVFDDKLDEASELVVTLDNRDRYFLLPDKGAILFKGKTIIHFQYGYEDPDGVGRGTHLSPWRSFPFSDISSVTEDVIDIKFTSPTAQRLQSVAKGTIFEGAKISSVVTGMVDALGYGPQNRIIQDTQYTVANLIITGQDSFLGNILRIGKKIGFVYYETFDSTGNPVFHFHKPGYRPVPEADTPLVGQTTSAVKGSPYRAPAFNEEGDGFFDHRAGVIAYLPDRRGDSLLRGAENVIADVLSFNFRYESSNVPANLELQVVDLENGEKVQAKLVGHADITSGRLSKRTPYNEPETDGFLQRLKTFFHGLSNKTAEEGGDESSRVAVLSGQESPTTQTMMQVTYGAGNQPKDQAIAEAQTVLGDAQSKTTTGDLSVVGDDRLAVGQVWFLKGFGIFDGDYLVRSCRHENGSGGYVTSVSFSTDGVDAVLGKAAKGSERKERERVNWRVSVDPVTGGGPAGTTVFNEPSEEK